MIQIRQAVYEDIPRIMQFVEEHWKRGHIVGNSREFFEWQFVEGNDVHFIIAEDENGTLYGMDGYILYSHEENSDISGCLWKTIKSECPFLGLKFGNVIEQEVRPRYGVGIGLNSRAQKIEKLQGNQISFMSHFYRLGIFDEYRIAKVINLMIPSYKTCESEFVPLRTMQEFCKAISDHELRKHIPYKDYTYIQHRYFEHFSYSYQLFQLVKEGKRVNAVFVMREVEHAGRRIMKIIDFYGDSREIAYGGMALDNLLKKEGYEFIDFYCYGVCDEVVQKAGFIKRTKDDQNVIPNYFEPFEQRNVEISVAGSALSAPNTRIFRGDGDQDRPSNW